MNQFDYQTYYKRRLPHYQPPGYKFFITFRLAKSLPESAIQQLRTEKERIKKILEKTAHPDTKKQLNYEIERRWFYAYDSFLDRAKTGPRWTGDPRIAELIAASINIPKTLREVVVEVEFSVNLFYQLSKRAF